MSSSAKPRLLFLRFGRADIPSFMKLHFDEHVRCLSQYFDVVVINDNTCDYKQLCEVHQPDIAMFESGGLVGERNVTNVTAYPTIPKIGFIYSDAFCVTRKTAIYDMVRWEISTFFSNSVSLGSYTPSIADKLFVWPNFVDPELYRDYGLPKVIPILFSGSQSSGYPWRSKIDRIVSQHYPTLHSPHFGWFWKGKKPSAAGFMEGESYARLINSARVAPSCGTISNEVVRKHFEIPACNTCLLTQRTAALEVAGFVDLVNCVFADDTDVLDKLEWLFQNPDELDRITRAGKELVDSQHTIRHRDQVFQWYDLHRKVKQGQRIVQPGPFSPLAVVEQHSAVTNRHVISGGVDRLLINQADEKLRSGKFGEAEILYRRCLNYITPNIPESELRLMLCLLHQGNAEAALAIAKNLTPSHRLSKKDYEPDPTEWAWFIITLLCCGKNREAALRSEQFATLHNEELQRVRCVVRLLRGESFEPVGEIRCGESRASVHQLPELTIGAWLENIAHMLNACGQTATAHTLRSAGANKVPTSHADISKQLKSLTKPVGNAFVKSYLATESRLDRFAQKIKPRMRKLMQRISRPVSNPASWNAQDERAAIVRLLQKEELKSGILIGASNGSWLSEAFICGMQHNPNMPVAVCINSNTPGFRKFHRRFADDANVEIRYVPSVAGCAFQSNAGAEAVAIDCDEILNDAEFSPAGATLVLFSRINNKAGGELFQAMLANENYLLVLHEPSHCHGYAVFRKAAMNAMPAHTAA